MLKTALTEQYGLEHPIVEAGMAFVGMPPLAIAVSQAGAMGTLGAAMVPPEALRLMIQAVRSQTARPFGVNFITQFTPPEAIEVCIEERVPVVSFHWNDPPADYIRRLREHGVKVWMQVGSVAMAEQLVSIGIDAIIAQGIEAGGHNRGTASTFALVPAIVDAVGSVPVLAAGGIGDGRGIAAALALGAAGVWVGTRLVATKEAFAHDEYKRRIVAAGVADTAVTQIFGPEWPGVAARVLRNHVVAELEGKPQPPPFLAAAPSIGHTVLGGQQVVLPRYSALLPIPTTQGDFEQMCMVAGESCGLIHSIESAGEVIRQMAQKAEQVIRERLGGMVHGAKERV